MPIVSDAGPILSFTRAGQLELLRTVVGELIIPDAVRRELYPRNSTVGAVALRQEWWIKLSSLRNPSAADLLPRKLH
jgi:predicted nucleic acid-binding protein